MKNLETICDFIVKYVFSCIFKRKKKQGTKKELTTLKAKYESLEAFKKDLYYYESLDSFTIS